MRAHVWLFVSCLVWPSTLKADLGNLPGASIGVSTSSLEFSTQLHQTTTAYVEVVNYGTANMEVESVSVWGQGFWSDTTAPGFELLPSGKFAVRITFTPHDTGEFNGSVSIVTHLGLSEVNRALVSTRTRSNARIRLIADQIEELNRKGSGVAQIDAEEAVQIPELTKRWREIDKDVAALRQAWLNLQDEQRHALEELRAGHYCSECGRPASQIVREDKETFAQHIARVKGVALPATEEQLKKKKEYYDGLIQAALDRLNARAKDRDSAWTEISKARDRFQYQRDLAVASFNKEMNRLHGERAIAIRELQDEIAEINKLASVQKELVVTLHGVSKR